MSQHTQATRTVHSEGSVRTSLGSKLKDLSIVVAEPQPEAPASDANIESEDDVAETEIDETYTDTSTPKVETVASTPTAPTKKLNGLYDTILAQVAERKKTDGQDPWRAAILKRNTTQLRTKRDARVWSCDVQRARDLHADETRPFIIEQEVTKHFGYRFSPNFTKFIDENWRTAKHPVNEEFRQNYILVPPGQLFVPYGRGHYTPYELDVIAFAMIGNDRSLLDAPVRRQRNRKPRPEQTEPQLDVMPPQPEAALPEMREPEAITTPVVELLPETPVVSVLPTSVVEPAPRKRRVIAPKARPPMETLPSVVNPPVVPKTTVPLPTPVTTQALPGTAVPAKAKAPVTLPRPVVVEPVLVVPQGNDPDRTDQYTALNLADDDGSPSTVSEEELPVNSSELVISSEQEDDEPTDPGHTIEMKTPNFEHIALDDEDDEEEDAPVVQTRSPIPPPLPVVTTVANAFRKAERPTLSVPPAPQPPVRHEPKVIVAPEPTVVIERLKRTAPRLETLPPPPAKPTAPVILPKVEPAPRISARDQLDLKRMKTWQVANKLRHLRGSHTARWLLFAAALLTITVFVLPSRHTGATKDATATDDTVSDETDTSTPTQSLLAPTTLKASPTCQKVTRALLAQSFTARDQRDPKHWTSHTSVGPNAPYISCGSACIEHADGTVDVSNAQICTP